MISDPLCLIVLFPWSRLGKRFVLQSNTSSNWLLGLLRPVDRLVELTTALLRLCVSMFTRCTRGVAVLLYLLMGTGFTSDALLIHHSGISPEIDVSASTFAPTVVLLFTPVPTPARIWLLLRCRASWTWFTTSKLGLVKKYSGRSAEMAPAWKLWS